MLKIIFELELGHCLIYMRRRFTIYSAFLDIKNSISWYQEIIHISWYQKIEFLISRNHFLISKIDFLILRNVFWGALLLLLKYFLISRIWFLDIKKSFLDIKKYLHSKRCFPSLRNEKWRCYYIITKISHVISWEGIHRTYKCLWSELFNGYNLRIC